MTYEELSRLVFESETRRKASIGKITTDLHWERYTQARTGLGGQSDSRGVLRRRCD